jgi:hypothetical protein
MRRRGASSALEHAVQVHLACRNLGELGDGLFLAAASKLAKRRDLAKLEREMLRRARQLVGILERATPHVGANITDIRGRLRRRAIEKSFSNSRPPPRAA